MHSFHIKEHNKVRRKLARINKKSRCYMSQKNLFSTLRKDLMIHEKWNTKYDMLTFEMITNLKLKSNIICQKNSD